MKPSLRCTWLLATRRLAWLFSRFFFPHPTSCLLYPQHCHGSPAWLRTVWIAAADMSSNCMGGGGGAMMQLVNSLLCKHEDPSGVPRIHVKCWVQHHTVVIVALRTNDLWHLLASGSIWIGSVRLLSQKNKWSQQRKTPDAHTCMDMHTQHVNENLHTHTWTWTYSTHTRIIMEIYICILSYIYVYNNNLKKKRP